MDTVRVYFLKSRDLFDFQKRAGSRKLLPFPMCTLEMWFKGSNSRKLTIRAVGMSLKRRNFFNLDTRYDFEVIAL